MWRVIGGGGAVGLGGFVGVEVDERLDADRGAGSAAPGSDEVGQQGVVDRPVADDGDGVVAGQRLGGEVDDEVDDPGGGPAGRVFLGGGGLVFGEELGCVFGVGEEAEGAGS